MSSTATDVSCSVNGALRLGVGLEAGFAWAGFASFSSSPVSRSSLERLVSVLILAN